MSENDAPAARPRKRLGKTVWIIIGIVVLLGLAMIISGGSKVQALGNMTKTCGNCREVLMALNHYATDHGGEYPTGANANDALRELFKGSYITDERYFSSPVSFGRADNSIGQGPDYANALKDGENHWAMTQGVNGASPDVIPLIFENPASVDWPPRWSVTDANKPVPGRGWYVDRIARLNGRNGQRSPLSMAAPTGEWSGYSVIIGLKDGSVSNVPLGQAESGTATVVADIVTGKNIFEQAGPHEVLQVAGLPTTPKSAVLAEAATPLSQPTTAKEQPRRETFTSIKYSGNKITMISASECELESNGRVLIGSYTVEDKKIRFVFTTLGSQMVSYADVYSDGIVIRNKGLYDQGEVMLTPDGMAMREENIRKEREKIAKIAQDAPTMLIGEWNEVQINADKPNVIAATTTRVFSADGAWFMGGNKGAGPWRMKKDNEVEMNRGPFVIESNTFKITELSQNSYVIEMHKFTLGDGPSLLATLKGERISSVKTNAVLNQGDSMANKSSGETGEKSWAILIVGGWNHHRQFSEYFADGRYVHHPRSGADETGKWEINGGALVHRPGNGQEYSNKIVNLDAKELALDYGQSSPILYFERAGEVGADKTTESPGAQGVSNQEAAVPFLNCTLTYTSHSADWSLYVGGEAKGKGAYLSKVFEARGGRTYTGEMDYEIASMAGGKWKMTTLLGEDKSSRQEMICWITEGDARSGTLKAAGNIYDLQNQPMWPGGERVMGMVFTRGKHLSGGGNDASGPQMAATKPKTTEAEVLAFIAAHHAKASRGDIAGLVADYDQTVTFLDKGQVSPALIREEETKDRAKWPKGEERIIGKPIVVELGTDWQASYAIQFDRENNAGGWMSGTIDLTLTIRSEGAQLLITGQKAKVYDLKKSSGK